MDLQKDKESEDHNRTLAQLEKIIKERDKLANEIIQMRRLQIHISHQLADRYTANSEGEAEAEAEAEYRSGRPETYSAKSSKSVKFAKQTSSRKMSEHLVKPTAASEARVLAAKEKLKQKTNEVAAIAKLREIKKKRHSSFQPHVNEAHGPVDDDYSSVHESIVEEESMIEPEVGDDDQISDHNSYTRSSVSSNYSQSQSFNQSHPVSTAPSSRSNAVTAEE